MLLSTHLSPSPMTFCSPGDARYPSRKLSRLSQLSHSKNVQLHKYQRKFPKVFHFFFFNLDILILPPPSPLIFSFSAFEGIVVVALAQAFVLFIFVFVLHSCLNVLGPKHCDCNLPACFSSSLKRSLELGREKKKKKYFLQISLTQLFFFLRPQHNNPQTKKKKKKSHSPILQINNTPTLFQPPPLQITHSLFLCLLLLPCINYYKLYLNSLLLIPSVLVLQPLVILFLPPCATPKTETQTFTVLPNGSSRPSRHCLSAST